MAKRANPFVEDFVQQRKIHVGIKQFNNNEERLQKVYEKTLKLLFKGAKKPLVQDVSGTTDVIAPKSDGMKQLCITRDGTLSHTEVAATLIQNAQAQHCGCSCSVVETHCAYCEAALCNACGRRCSCCQNTYCSHCSLIGSEGSEVCVSCYN